MTSALYVHFMYPLKVARRYYVRPVNCEQFVTWRRGDDDIPMSLWRIHLDIRLLGSEPNQMPFISWMCTTSNTLSVQMIRQAKRPRLEADRIHIYGTDQSTKTQAVNWTVRTRYQVEYSVVFGGAKGSPTGSVVPVTLLYAVWGLQEATTCWTTHSQTFIITAASVSLKSECKVSKASRTPPT